jgi:hypothetical protein
VLHQVFGDYGANFTFIPLQVARKIEDVARVRALS